MSAATLTQPQQNLVPVLAFFVSGRPVSVNRMYGQRRTGGRYRTEAATAWIDAVWAEALIERHDLHWTPAPRQPLRIHCTFYGIRGDADNYLKATLDGLKIGLRIDDTWFNPVESLKLPGARRAPKGCLIEVYEGEQNDGAA